MIEVSVSNFVIMLLGLGFLSGFVAAIILINFFGDH